MERIKRVLVSIKGRLSIKDWFKKEADEYKVLEAHAVFKELLNSVPRQNITPDVDIETIMFKAGQEFILERLKALLERKGFDV